jgi:hypothetical protein
MTYLHHIDDSDVLQYPSIFFVLLVLFNDEVKKAFKTQCPSKTRRCLMALTTGEVHGYEENEFH